MSLFDAARGLAGLPGGVRGWKNIALPSADVNDAVEKFKCPVNTFYSLSYERVEKDGKDERDVSNWAARGFVRFVKVVALGGYFEPVDFEVAEWFVAGVAGVDEEDFPQLPAGFVHVQVGFVVGGGIIDAASDFYP